MKYYETSKFPKFVGSAGFYSIIALCLIALGAISWFAVSRYNAATEKPQSSVESPAYEEPSYESEVAEPEVSQPSEETSQIAEASKEDVPYEESSKPQIEEQKPQSFIVPIEGNVSKDYSDTALQYSKTYGDMRLHTGIDILCAVGSEVKSAGNGTVTDISEGTEYGKTLTIDHGDGIIIKYCGFDTLAVSKSESVTTGRVLGTVGTVTSECADESHIHIEAEKDGKTVSPLKILGLE